MTPLEPAMFELFREEVRGHAAALTAGLVELEADAANPEKIEPLMRAAHSIKGAAKIVGVESAVQVAHVLEDALVAAQAGRIRLVPVQIDVLLRAADLLAELGVVADAGALAEWAEGRREAVAELEPALQAVAGGEAVAVAMPEPETVMAAVSEPRSVRDSSIPPAPLRAPVAIPAEPIPLDAEHGVFDLFREELRSHLATIAASLDGASDDALEAVRQLRGSARLLKLPAFDAVFEVMANGVRVLPDAAVAAWIQHAVDVLASGIACDPELFPDWLASVEPQLHQVTAALGGVKPPPPPQPEPVKPTAPVAKPQAVSADGVVRVTAQSLNRLMGLAGESLVQARWLNAFSTSLAKLKKQHEHLAGMLDDTQQAASAGRAPDQLAALLAEARRHADSCRAELTGTGSDFDEHAARAENLNARLYREVIASRMRPFADGLHGLARTVRDMARSLGKQAKLEVIGEATDVDRDVLEKLEAPLAHLIRNAVDHGLEPPDQRAAACKPATGVVRVEARHRAGMLSVTIADDGRGVDLEKLRRKIVERGLSSSELVKQMNEAELLEFLFLPGFSTAGAVTEYSGRGVGLDVVQDTVRKVGGSVRITSKFGEGTTFHLHLPITLSVIRAVVVEVGGEPYAFPHTRIDRLLRVPRDSVRSLEHRQFVAVDGQNVGLVLAGQLLDVPVDPPKHDDMPVVLLSDSSGLYGLVVDAFRGEQDLVVRPLDPRLGKVPNLSAAAVLDDGEPVLIVDVEDLVRSMDTFIQTGALRGCELRDVSDARKKRVLVVDDSITVREVERQLLLHQGYDVTVAVDGMDGWNQVRAGNFDLLVSDVDMPRMSGLQLVQAVRADDRLKHLPVIIVSYKEREEDRQRGLEVGANAYLTKSSFHDNRFVEAVQDLIGAA
ncbi:MAG: hybrid sensor histidine kinase/response regulator [Gemmataceae bacterium]